MAYYVITKVFADNTLAVGTDVLFETTAIASSFDTVETAISALVGDVSALQAGGSPGWGASIDIRWLLTSVSGTNTITATAPAGPTASDALVNGQFYYLIPANDNTGAATLNIGTTEGAEDIKKNEGGAWTALGGGELQAGIHYQIIYDTTENAWLIIGSGAGLDYFSMKLLG